MNIIMHLLFSYKMRKIIKGHSGVKLNLIGFMYGNILPDIKAIHKPHQINGSLTFLVKRAQSLIANPVQTVPPPIPGRGNWASSRIICRITSAMPIRIVTTKGLAATCFTN